MDRLTEAELRQRIAAGSQESDDYGRLADILAVGGQTQAAIDVLERALTLPPGRLGRAEVLAGLGWLLYECTKHNDRARYRPGEARRSFEQALVALTGDPLLRAEVFAREARGGLRRARRARAGGIVMAGTSELVHRR